MLQGAYLADQGHSGGANSYNQYLGCGDHLHFSRQIGPGVWEQSVPTDFAETPCAMGCPAAYSSSNTELAPAPTLLTLVPSRWTAGSTVTVTVSGRDFVFGSTAAVAAAGITVTAVSVLSPTRIAMTLNIAGGVSPGAYNVTVTSSNGASNSIPFQVIAAGSGGSLSSASSTPSGAQQLTTLGTVDWAHWGLSTSTSFNHKVGIVPQIGDYTTVGSVAPVRISNSPANYSWSDGTPAASAINTTTGVNVSGQNNGFSITAPADTSLRTLTVYAGVSSGQGSISARLSDGSAPAVVDTSLANAGGSSIAAFTFTYAAASAGQTLVVTFTQASSGGSVSLFAATLGGTVPGPDFTVSALPSVRSVAPGASGVVTVSVSALSGFTGAVDLSVSGLPAGTTSGFNPLTITGGGTSTLTVNVAGGTSPGTYPLILTGSNGAVIRTAPVSLVVVNADFLLSAAPAARTLFAGGSVTQNVTVDPLPGFSGSVSLSVAGLPAGVTATFSPTMVTGSGISALTLSAAAGAATGDYPVVVTGSSGSVTRTANFTLAVRPTGGASGSLTGSSAAAPATTQLTAEGTLDWAHWGLNAAADVNRKGSVSPQITMALVGGSIPNRFTGNPVGFSWTDGNPVANVSNTVAGIYMLGQDRGFRITVPANTTTKILRMYVGIFQSQGRMLAQLSDGSAPDFLDTSLSNANGTSVAVYTLAYRAASAGQTLTVTWTQNDATLGNITLEAATLSARIRVSATPTTQSVVAGGDPICGECFYFERITGAVIFGISGLPAGSTATFTPSAITGNGSSTLNVSTAATTTFGDYPLVVTASSGSITHAVNLTLTVITGAGGALSGSVAPPPTNVQLTTEGTSDWAHWALNTASDFNHKAAVTSQISNYSSLTGTAASPFHRQSCHLRLDRRLSYGCLLQRHLRPLSFRPESGLPPHPSCRHHPADSPVICRRLACPIQDRRPFERWQRCRLCRQFPRQYFRLRHFRRLYLDLRRRLAGQTLTVTFTQTSATAGNINLQAATLSQQRAHPPDFTIAATPATQSTAAGSVTPYTVTVSPLNGFSASVALSVSGLPTGATGALAPPQSPAMAPPP